MQHQSEDSGRRTFEDKQHIDRGQLYYKGGIASRELQGLRERGPE